MLARIVRILRRRSPVELAVMLTDRLVRPLGISLISFTRYGPIPAVGSDTAREKFDGIARGNLWGSSESLSGPGSELARSEPYRAELTKLLRQGRFQSMFDAPCGDLNWMRLVLDQVDIDYAGGDISPSIIELNRSRFPGRAFTVFDITRDDFPAVDVWHCRDCLFHLSYADIRAALRNFTRSSIPYALITSHRGLIRNVDIETGGWRYLSLTRYPFNFAEPESALTDHLPGDLPRIVGLWSRETIRECLDRSMQERRSSSKMA